MVRVEKVKVIFNPYLLRFVEVNDCPIAGVLLYHRKYTR